MPHLIFGSMHTLLLALLLIEVTHADQGVTAPPPSAMVDTRIGQPSPETTGIPVQSAMPSTPNTPEPQPTTNATPPTASSPTIEKASAVIIPHKATYKISLDDRYHANKTYPEEDIVNVNGEMTIQIVHAGGGWSMLQKSTIHIYHMDGTVEQVRSTFSTWESDDGLKYNFVAHTISNDEEESIRGDAIVPTPGGAGIVTYQQPDESTIQLPVGTVFPMQHLILMLTAAMQGKSVISNIVFDGSSETHEPVQVDTVLGAGQDPKLVINNHNILKIKKVWPMRMAVYPENSTALDADYKIVQHVLDLGVIRDMTLNFGAFEVKAVLTDVEVFQDS